MPSTFHEAEATAALNHLLDYCNGRALMDEWQLRAAVGAVQVHLGLPVTPEARAARPYEAYALGLLTMLISKHMQCEVVQARPDERWVHIKAMPSGKILRLTLEEVEEP